MAMLSVINKSAPGLPPSCASEPIQVPGSIQPHGLLLLFDNASGGLAHWAGDFDRLLGIAPTVGGAASELLGRRLDELIALRPLIRGEEPAYVGSILPAGKDRLAIQTHRTGRFVAVELQHAGDERGATPALEQVRAISARIASQPNLHDACAVAAQEVRAVSGYDRIMIYRFLEDGSGAVIAEARAENAKAFFNHRFPSSDIPRQARELYRRNLMRTIPDVAYSPLPIEIGPGQLIDMSHCVLRSVSPVHIQYLKNMDVGASMSISLLVDGQLWGLIACHHHCDRSVPVETQLLCRHVGTCLSSFILSFGQAESARLDGLQRVAVESALQSLRSSNEPDRTLRMIPNELKALVPSGGFALLAHGELVAGVGRIPVPEDLRSLAPLVDAQLQDRESYWTDRVGEALPGAPSITASGSGLLAIRLDASEPLLALWFRPEQVEEVEWAGDPGQKEQPANSLAPLTPRRSFATWRETVRGRSRPWMWFEIKAVELFQSRAGYTLQRHRLKQLNGQLTEANAGLSALATTDPLTGLPNRRLFDERLCVEWQRALRHSNSVGLVAIDVDHFKHYNDCFGHPAGDECLKQVAAAIHAARRSIDVAARIGGEEFAILLPDVDANSTAAVAERVRLAVEGLCLDHPQTEDKVVTISVGTAVGCPTEFPDVSELIHAADAALYVAKANGRNRVFVGT